MYVCECTHTLQYLGCITINLVTAGSVIMLSPFLSLALFSPPHTHTKYYVCENRITISPAPHVMKPKLYEQN